MRKKVKELTDSVRSKKHLCNNRVLLYNNKPIVSGLLKTNTAKRLQSLYIFGISFCIILLAWGIIFCPVVFAAQTNNHIDAIIIMDTSGSMNGSDQDRVSIEAAKMFVDMMDINGSRVGMLGFSDTIAPRIMMSDVSNRHDKETIKQAIDNFSYQGYTDIGMALKQAQFIYENAPKNGNSPIALLFTDGNIEIDETNPERTYTESIQDINNVIKFAKDTLPIYTIGLNSNGSVDETLLKNISNATGGRCYITNSPKDLPAIFNEIFADHIKSSIIDVDVFFSDGATYKDVTINIPDDNVIEANIIIFSEKELIDAKITDPNNILQESGNAVIFTKSAKYSIIKLLRPLKGDWTLSISGQKEDLIKVNLLFDYQIYINMNISPETEIKEGTELKIEASLATEGSDIIDPSLSEIFDAYFVISDNLGYELERIPLTNDTGGSYSATYTITEDISDNHSQVTVYCIAESDRVFRESQRVTLSIAREQAAPEPSENKTPTENTQPKAPPTIKSEIKNISIVYVPILFGKTALNLSNHFENATSYTADCKQNQKPYITAAIENHQLKLTPTAQGSGTITVTANNGSGETVSLSFTAATFNILPYILIGLTIIALAILTYLLKKSNKLKNTLYSGNIRMVSIDSQGSYSPPELIDLSYSTGVTDLRSLVQDTDKGTLPLNKITVYPSFDSKGLPVIGVINKSGCTVIGDFGVKLTDKKFMWYNNQTITIKDENNAEASALELEYRN